MQQKIKIQQDGVAQLINLADVPHGDLIGSKDYEDGRHIDFYEAVHGTQVIAYDEQTGEPKWVDVSGWSRHTGSPIELVQLSSGDTISTDDDPRAVYGMPIDSIDLQMDRTTPTDAKERCFIVPILPQLPKTTKEFVSVDMAAGGIPSNEHPSPEHFVFAADYELGQFLGAMAGDGWWNKKEYDFTYDGSFYLSDLEGYNAAFIIDYLSSRVNGLRHSSRAYKKADDPSRYGDTVKWCFIFNNSMTFCNALSNMLDGHGDDFTTGSANKRLPSWFFSMPYDFRLGLLNGIIATDGSISPNGSGQRKHAELVIQATSTSRRLVDDIKALCSTLGIRSKVGFSKTTTKGNSSWYVNISVVDAKRLNAFVNCCHTRKRETFNAAEVSFASQNNHGDIIPLPKQVSDTLSKYISCKNKVGKPVIESCPLPAFFMRGASIYQSLYQYKDKGYITRDFASRFCELWNDKTKMSFWCNDYIKAFKQRLANGETTFIKEEVNTLIEAIAFNADYFLNDDVLEVRAKASMLRQKGTSFPKTLESLLSKVLLKEEYTLLDPVAKEPLLRSWVALAYTPMKWAFIERVDKTGQVEEGYDLTVPGYETFASDSGVILSNTMTYYVPVSRKAVQEAYDLMLPSKNQLAARDFKALPEMQEELVSGAWLASHKKNGPVKAVFNTPAEAVAAYRAGKIDVDDNIIIKSQQ